MEFQKYNNRINNIRQEILTDIHDYVVKQTQTLGVESVLEFSSPIVTFETEEKVANVRVTKVVLIGAGDVEFVLEDVSDYTTYKSLNGEHIYTEGLIYILDAME